VASTKKIVDIDIATRVIGDEEDIFIIRPGQDFTLYADFRKKGVAFLDFPDLDLLLFKSKWENEKQREAVLRSSTIRDWHLTGRSKDQQPSRAHSDYEGRAKGMRLGAHVASVKRFYLELPVGTIIVVPGPGYFSDVLVGQLSSKVISQKDIGLYRGEVVPARRVDWLGQKQKSEFSEEAIARLQNQKPIIALDRSLRKEFIPVAFDQYVFEGVFSSKFLTTELDFSTLDDFNFQAFTNYVAGVLVASRELDMPHENVTMSEALEALHRYRDLIPELATNINSPGFLRLSSEQVYPLVIAAIFSLALAAGASAQSANVRVHNSSALQEDPCAIKVEKHVEAAMSLMGTDEWRAACKNALRVSKSAGLKSSVKAQKREAVDDDGS
jgi:hypothetical protein|tara:strand:- start:3792 stop:4943 length:1152 start_codon:yes stop_codon:yes gene_type:complete